jgi:hypothetical protein
MCHDVWCDAVLFLDLISLRCLRPTQQILQVSHTITAFNLQLKVCVTFLDMMLWSLAHPCPRCTQPCFVQPGFFSERTKFLYVHTRTIDPGTVLDGAILTISHGSWATAIVADWVGC